MRTTYAVIAILLFSGICSGQSTVTDVDGNIYKTVTIGDQIWMAENLRVTKYRNGENIPLIKRKLIWRNYKTGAYCYYKNNPGNRGKYGALYNWYTVNDSNGICPAGWHVPSNDEWKILALNISPTMDSFHGDEWYIDLEYFFTDKLQEILYVGRDTSYEMTLQQMHEFLKNQHYDTLYSKYSYQGDIVAMKMKSMIGWPDGENGNNSSGFSGIPGGEIVQENSVNVVQRVPIGQKNIPISRIHILIHVLTFGI